MPSFTSSESLFFKSIQGNGEVQEGAVTLGGTCGQVLRRAQKRSVCYG